ncbi:two-component system sensor histidine kinase YesM [Paenibacillus shirakamiensis]|uniref:histidine kinase n=1 Tax=Paenibacillus shirakamiensis TaxID=1265935 RepID=A0ABS4JNM6_9BACL|nr:sensor histidine kinase [Paenibacillus shirakamiensis]MBP2002229.1 two-component system sensor histidine kinase YesM [Paenibacillus shirakamiensis]
MNSPLQFRKLFYMRHLNTQIFVLMIVTITLPLMLISGIIYRVSLQTVQTEYKNSSDLILNNLSFNIDQYLQSIEKGTLYAHMDGQLQNALENWISNPTEDQKINYQYVIQHFIATLEMTIKNVNSVQIYSGHQLFFSANFNRADINYAHFEQDEWYQKTLARKGAVVIFGTHTPFHKMNSTEKVISIARVINKTGGKQPLGVMLVDIRLDSLSEILNLSENTKRKFVITDQTGAIIYASNQPGNENISKPLKIDNQKFNKVLTETSGSFSTSYASHNSYLNFVTSPYSGWKVIQYIDEKEMTKDSALLSKIILALAVGSIGMAILFMVMMRSRVTKPIILLKRQVEKVGMGNFDVDLGSTRRDEFGVLYQGLRKMVAELQNYIERSSMAKAQQKIARLGALKSQINPHFLANTLESVQMKAILSGERDIAEMVGTLGQLFRIHTQMSKDIIPLYQELEHIRLYVKVQQMRFGDKINYVEELAPGTDTLQVVHFSLQPLIENAIIHGLERQVGTGLLEVSTSLSDHFLLITIRDNGVGMNHEQLYSMQQRLFDHMDVDPDSHIGLINVNERIRLYFGEQYGLYLSSTLGEGTTITIRLPALPYEM